MLDLCYNYVVSMILPKFYRQLRKIEIKYTGFWLIMYKMRSCFLVQNHKQYFDFVNLTYC